MSRQNIKQLEELEKMNRFANYLGYIQIELNGEKFEVRPTLRHKQQLLGIQQNTKKGLSEQDWARQHAIFKEILKTSLTEEEKLDESIDAKLEAFLLENDMPFMLKLYEGFGWLKEGDVSSLKEELLKKQMEDD